MLRLPKTFPVARMSLLAACSMLALGCTIASSPASAADMCKTPDGFFLAAAKQPAKPADKGNDDEQDGRGMGGTGILALGDGNGKGIGGTGIRFAEGGKGMGGTGISFDGSVIVKGRITGFGSICVNGLEVQYSKTTPVTSAGAALTTDSLRIGNIVSVLAVPHQGEFQAQKISLDHILSGKVDSVDAQKGLAGIDGQTVLIGKGNPPIKPGDTVLVSGFKDAGGRIVASMIEKTDRPASPENAGFGEKAQHAAMQGYITAGVSDRQFRMGDTIVSIAKDAAIVGGKLEDVGANSRVLVFGDMPSGRHIEAEMIVIEHKEIETEISVIERETESAHTREDRSGEQEAEEAEQDDADTSETPEADETETETETPEAEAPESESPEVEAPETEAPEVEAPEMEAPEVEAPEIEAPEVETPEVEPPEVELPES